MTETRTATLSQFLKGFNMKCVITMKYTQIDEYNVRVGEKGLLYPDGEPFDSIELDPEYVVYRADDENKSFPLATFETCEQAINFIKEKGE